MVDLANMLGRAVGQAVNSVVQSVVVRPDPRGPSAAGGQFGRAAGLQGYAAPQGNLGEQFAQLPETFDLSQSRSLSSLVELSLVALGFMDKRKADGNLDGTSLDAMNKFRTQHGQSPLASFEEFGKEDVGALLKDLSEKPNTERTKVFSQAGTMLQKGLKELTQKNSPSGWNIDKGPLPEAPPPSPSFGGG